MTVSAVSAVYDAEVRHHRQEPAHDVRQRVRLAYLDLDELPGVVARRFGWSTRPAPVWFRRRDYLDGTDRPLAGAVADLVEERTDRRPTGPIRVLTQVRTLGWLFNPLTAYYCFTPDGQGLDVVVLEVTNTPWHERHWYVLDGAEVTSREGATFPKAFHVSPFLPMELTYRCRTAVPGHRVRLHLELSRPGPDGTPDVVFDAGLTGRRETSTSRLSPTRALRTLTQTARVSAGIYAHAAVLLARGARVHRHPSAHDVSGSPS